MKTFAQLTKRLCPFSRQPGHALVITQWKPELALSTDPTLINLTVPDAIPTIKAIWKGVWTITVHPGTYG